MSKLSGIILIIVFAFSTAYGQDKEFVYVEHNTSSWGFKIGAVSSKLSPGSANDVTYNGYPVTYDIDNSAGFSTGLAFGIYFENRLANKLFFQAEANYEMLKYKVKYSMQIDDEALSERNADFTSKVSSVQIPLLLKYRVGNKTKFYVYLGPYMGFPLSSRNTGEIEVIENINPEKPTIYKITGNNISSNPEKFEIGWLVGGGLKVPMKTNAITIEIRGGRSFNDILKAPNYKANSIAIHLGLIKSL